MEAKTVSKPVRGMFIACRLTPDERAIVVQAAQRSRLSVSAWLRRAVVRALREEGML